MKHEDKEVFMKNMFFKRSWMGQKGWIRPTVLSLLEWKPMNGMEIMDLLEEKSKGWWRPSPGSIYPLLEELSKEGIVKKGKDGRYTVIHKESAQTDSDELDEVLTNIESNISYIEDLAASDSRKVKSHAKRIDSIANRLKNIK